MQVTNTNIITPIRWITDSITRPSNTTAYTIGDAISEVTTNDFFTFSGVCASPNYASIIREAMIFSSANQSATYLDANLFLFAQANAPGEDADNAAWSPTDAELLTCIAIINFPAASWVQGIPTAGAGGNALCSVVDLNRHIRIGEADIVGQLVAGNAYTPVSAEVLTVSLGVEQR